MIRARIAVLIALVSGCQIFVSDHIGQGIGSTCAVNDDCQDSSCISGVCAEACSESNPCSNGAVCSNGACRNAIKAAFILAGDPATDDWALSHENARKALANAKPAVDTMVFPNTSAKQDVSRAVDSAVAAGARILFANSAALSAEMQIKVYQETDPSIIFFTYSNRSISNTHELYEGRLYKGWWLAGKAAAHKAPKQARLGMVASFVTPEVVRNVNAFALGARTVNASIVVEVRWLFGWHGSGMPGAPDEATLATELAGTGCEVIGHQADNGKVVTAIESLAMSGSPVRSIGYHRADACPPGSQSCIGSIYWNWEPLYAEAVARVETPPPPAYYELRAGMTKVPTTSVVNVKLVDKSLSDLLSDDFDAVEAESENEVGAALTGKYCYVDGSCVGAGKNPSDEELDQMCKFVKGVVEKVDPADASSADKDALVPLQGDCAPAPM